MAECPVKGCSLPIDLTLLSSDGVRIGAHKSNLELYTDGFPTSDSVSDSEGLVELTEDGETLKLLMHFCHKHKYPNVTGLSTDRLLKLAEAAEKYIAEIGIIACSTALRYRAEETPIEILAYAAKYNHPHIADVAAPLTIHLPVSRVDEAAGSPRSQLTALWFRYREGYEGVIRAATVCPAMISYIRTGKFNVGIEHVCTTGAGEYFPKTLSKIPRGNNELCRAIVDNRLPGQANFADEYEQELQACGKCRERANTWHNNVRSALEMVPKFSSLMG